jgi:hypothetical protein
MRSILGSLGATLLVALVVVTGATPVGASTQDAPQSDYSPVQGHGTMDTYP